MDTFLYFQDQATEVARLEAALAAADLPADLVWVNDQQAFLNALGSPSGYDLILAGTGLEAGLASEALALAKQRWPETPFFLISDQPDDSAAMALLAEGASDCLACGQPARLGHGLRQGLQFSRQAALLREARSTASRATALVEATLAATAVGVLVTDLTGKVASYNRSLLSLCGLPEQVLAPMRLDSVLRFLVEQFEDPSAFLQEALRLGPGREASGLLSAKNGQILEARVRSQGLGEATQGRVFDFREVTDRERASAERKRTAANQQALLQAAGVARLTPWFLEADHLVLAESASLLLDLPAEQLPMTLGALESLIHPEDQAAFRQALRQPGRTTVEVRLRKGDATWTPTRCSLETSGTGGSRGAFLDLSGQPGQGEGHRPHQEGMGVLADGAARAFGDKIRKLRNRLQLLEGSRPLTELQRRHLNAVGATTSALEQLLGQLAYTSQAGVETCEPIQVNDLLEAFRPRAEATLPQGISLKLQPGAGLPPLALNPAHLEEVLLALVLNARDALQDSGEILIRTGLLEEAQGIFLEIQDDGPPLPPAVQARMFSPFFTTKAEGHGLGLWVARRVVESYGGSIRAEAAKPKGTRLRLEWPEPARVQQP